MTLPLSDDDKSRLYYCATMLFNMGMLSAEEYHRILTLTDDNGTAA